MKKRNKKKIHKTPDFVICALDQATHCGFALNTGISGVWDLSVKKDESDGMRLIRFRAKLREVIINENVKLVAFERPAGRNARGIITSAELQGQIKTICKDLSVEYRAYSATEIKQFATGKGNCGKPAMIAAAREKLGYKGDDDNEADALWILELAKNDYL
jgi:Holliday junction resolvasome RuvABC endonuclease subunit